MVTSSSNLLKTLELLLARLEFIMSHLLPVQMDTLIKFLRFLRCSWTTEPNWAERFFEKWASEYDPESPTGLEGVDFGEDAVTIQDNILDQLVLAADQLKDLSFKPITSSTKAPSSDQEILHAEEALTAWTAFIDQSSVYSYIVHL